MKGGEGQVKTVMCESNKLEGGSNYNVWRLKLIAWFKEENMWEIVDSKVVSTFIISHISFIISHIYTEQIFKG